MSHTAGGASAYRPSDAPDTGSGGRQAFSGRTVFILAAIGSAVGLGNIWRYPYVAYSNGGGAFLVPYLVALLTAAIPLLFVDYAMGHKFRGSAPLAFSRLKGWLQPFGWIQTLMCFVIATYYAVVLAWATRYFFYSFNLAWGDDPEGFFNGTVLQVADTPSAFGSFVGSTALVLAALWAVSILIVWIGVDAGIGWLNRVFLPLMMVVFAALVIRALLLDGAADGLNAFFSPDWAALKDAEVWVAAYGQVFFSTSVAIGAMLTYASYLHLKTNLTGSGLVVGFSNASFEVLAGIGVFACIGFLAHQQGVAVDEAAAGGPGLTFVVFPALISEMPFGNVFGVLFFGCLLLAGVTSLVSLMQVVGAAFADKAGVSHRTATLVTGTVMALVSLAFYPRSTGLYVLDVTDNWVNNVLLVGSAGLACIVLTWVALALPRLARHLNTVSSFRLGKVWMFCVGVLTPAVLAFTTWDTVKGLRAEPYEGYPTDFINTFGWGMVGAVLLLSVLLSFVPFRNRHLHATSYDLEDPEVRAIHGVDTTERGYGHAATTTYTEGGRA